MKQARSTTGHSTRQGCRACRVNKPLRVLIVQEGRQIGVGCFIIAIRGEQLLNPCSWLERRIFGHWSFGRRSTRSLWYPAPPGMTPPVTAPGYTPRRPWTIAFVHGTSTVLV